MILRSSFSETPVLSMALTLRYPYLPLEATNAPATRTRSPAYMATWRKYEATNAPKIVTVKTKLLQYATALATM